MGNFDITKMIDKLIQNSIVLGASIVIYILIRLFVRFIVLRRKDNRTKTIMGLINNIVAYVIFFVAIVTILATWGVDSAPIIASAGFLGLAVGFGAQKMVQDMISGFFIILEKQFDVGDSVMINDKIGTVESIGLKTTLIKSWKGELHVFSNGDINSITNYSKYPSIADIKLKVSHNNSIEKVPMLMEKFVNEINGKNEFVLDKPAFIGIDDSESDGYVIRFIATTKPFEHFSVQRWMREQLILFLQKNEIDMPESKMTVKK